MDRQCSSCGGFCKKSGCERENVKPEPEPVAWANLNALTEQINSVNCGTVYRLPSEAEGRQPLYTAPPQREWQGLTDEEYEAMAETYVTNCYFDTLKYAKAIEAKLKEKNSG